MSRRIGRSWLTGLMTAFASCVPASAALNPFIYEGFDYTLAQPLAGQQGGVGWGAGNPWGVAGVGASTATVVAGLTFSDYAVTGNAVMLSHDTTQGQLVAGRQIMTDNPSPEVWVSYLWKPVVSTAGNTFAAVQVSETDTGDPDTAGVPLRMRHVARFYGVDGGGFGRGGVGADNTEVQASANFAVGDVFLLIAKFTGVDTNANTATWWALSEANYDALTAFSEAQLNANNIATASDASGTLIGFAPGGANDFIQIQVYHDGNGAYAPTIDELRFASSLSDLFVIPEPAASATLSVALLLLLRRRIHGGR